MDDRTGIHPCMATARQTSSLAGEHRSRHAFPDFPYSLTLRGRHGMTRAARTCASSRVRSWRTGEDSVDPGPPQIQPIVL